MEALGLAFSGAPATLAEKLSAQVKETGANYLVGQFVFGDMTLEESRHSIDLFSTKVMGEIRR
jgi:hypothetical protein